MECGEVRLAFCLEVTHSLKKNLFSFNSILTPLLFVNIASMSFWRSHQVLGIMSITMGIHFLNLSIDPPDAQPYWVAEDLSVNETETLIEMVLENVLNFADSFPEHEDHNDHHGTHSFVHISHSYVNQPITTMPQNGASTQSKYFVTDETQKYFCPDFLKTPPPKI